jgi:hypothetical protein
MKSREEYEHSAQEAAQNYTRWLDEQGMQSNEILMRAYVKQVLGGWKREAEEVKRGRIEDLIREHKQRDLAIRREGARMAVWTCPPIALMLLLLAWWGVASGNALMGLVYAVGALAFLVMLAIVLWQVRKAAKELLSEVMA